jgi:cystinosin
MVALVRNACQRLRASVAAGVASEARASAVLVALSICVGLVLGLSVPETGLAAMPRWAQVVSNVAGWTSFAAWLISFLPQLVLNAVRGSVVGMSFNAVLLGTVGFVCYAVFTLAMYWVPAVRQEYQSAHGGALPVVTGSDVFFCLWAVVLEGVAIAQILAYRRGGQTVSRWTWAALVVLCAVITALLCLPHAPPTSPAHLGWVAALTWVSWIKIGVTVVRYLPQIHLNAVRRSTAGFNIASVVLDALGGTLSLTQLLLDCGATGDWSGIAGDPVKAALGALTLLYDAIYLGQHAWYRKRTADGDGVDGAPSLLLPGAHADAVPLLREPTVP